MAGSAQATKTPAPVRNRGRLCRIVDVAASDAYPFSLRQLREFIKRGLLPAVRVGKYLSVYERDLAMLLDDHYERAVR